MYREEGGEWREEGYLAQAKTDGAKRQRREGAPSHGLSKQKEREMRELTYITFPRSRAMESSCEISVIFHLYSYVTDLTVFMSLFLIVLSPALYSTPFSPSSLSFFFSFFFFATTFSPSPKDGSPPYNNIEI